MKFVVIADDNTGATDAAGMLTGQGVKTCQVNSVDAIGDSSFIKSYDALVIGLQNRSVDPAEAYESTKKAVRIAESLHPEMIQIKYCSTFDSTRKGNIGQFLDAATDCTGQKYIVVCPALPVNGRTTHMGNHYVKGVLMSESPMKDHPLNPMTDANLVRWLGYQTKRKTGLLPLDEIRKGTSHAKTFLEKLSNEGISYIICDALIQDDIRILAEAVARQKVISGGSGITAEIPAILFPDRKPLSFNKKISSIRKGTIVLSGSLSKVTQQQTDHALTNGFKGVKIDPVAIINNQYNIENAVAEGTRHLGEGRNIIICSSSDTKEKVQAAAIAKGMNDAQAGEMIGHTLAMIGEKLLSFGQAGRLIVSGGETSGSICRHLKFDVLEIGLPLDPGVPYCFPANMPNLLLVLKSGNFGSIDLYTKVSKL